MYTNKFSEVYGFDDKQIFNCIEKCVEMGLIRIYEKYEQFENDYPYCYDILIEWKNLSLEYEQYIQPFKKNKLNNKESLDKIFLD